MVIAVVCTGAKRIHREFLGGGAADLREPVAAVGLDTRVYFFGDKMRPYARAAISYGKMAVASTYNAYTFGIEGGVGAVLSAIRTPTNPQTQRSIRIEFYGEANARVLLGGWEEGEMCCAGGTGIVSEADSKQAFVVALDFGLMYRW